MAQFAPPIIITPPRDAAALIADCGHPGFPGWELIAVLLMAATVCVLLGGDPGAALRRRAGDGRVPPRVVASQTNPVRFVSHRVAA